MKLSNINIHTSRNMLLTTMLATSIAAGAFTSDTSSNDSFEKQKIETVDKSVTEKFISTVKDIDKYDSKIIDTICDDSEEPFTDNHKTLVRFLAGMVMSGIGGLVGTYRQEKGCKYLAKYETAANWGFLSGFVLPGVTSCAVLAASIGVLLKSIGTSLLKK